MEIKFVNQDGSIESREVEYNEFVLTRKDARRLAKPWNATLYLKYRVDPVTSKPIMEGMDLEKQSEDKENSIEDVVFTLFGLEDLDRAKRDSVSQQDYKAMYDKSTDYLIAIGLVELPEEEKKIEDPIG